jgi:hypothetical protein
MDVAHGEMRAAWASYHAGQAERYRRQHWGAVMEVAASLCTKKLVGGGEVRAAVRRQRTDRS